MGVLGTLGRLRYRFYGGYASSEVDYYTKALAVGLTSEDIINSALAFKSGSPSQNITAAVNTAVQQAIAALPSPVQNITNNIINQKLALFSATASKVITNTATTVSIIPTGIGTMVIPADFLTVGKTLRLTVGGIYQTPTLLAGNITPVVRLGSATLASSSVIGSLLTLGSTTNRFSGEILITCLSVGTTGKVIVDGSLDYVTSSGFVSVAMNNNGNPITIDTTVAQTLDCMNTWSSAKAGQGTVTTTAILEALN